MPSKLRANLNARNRLKSGAQSSGDQERGPKAVQPLGTTVGTLRSREVGQANRPIAEVLV